MPLSQLTTAEQVNFFPDLETILNFGMFSRNLINGEWKWSKGIYHILGLEDPTVIASTELFISFIVPEEREYVSQSAKRAFENNQNYSIEFSITDAQGKHKRLYSETLFKIDNQGQIYQYNGILKDITESYEFKKALELKVQQLDKSNQNLQEFVYVASHDLQEPVRKISTFAERLSSKYSNALGEEGNMYLLRMQNASRNMQTLLEDLLSFSRLSFNDKPSEKVSLNACLESVLNDLEVKIEETKTQIELTDLPVIEGYFTQLKQLFYNLIGNAIKFRKPGENARIKLKFTRVNPYSLPQYPLLKNTHYAKIEISDEGIGFEQEFSERIFMIFQRLNSKVEYSGSGIGLSICKKITENHHGVIYATGAVQQGSCFTILLPYTIS